MTYLPQNFLTTNLRYLRNKKGITQQDVADEIHKTQQCYAYWETGKNEPDVYSVSALAKLHGVTVDDIVQKDLRYQTNTFVKFYCANQGL